MNKIKTLKTYMPKFMMMKKATTLLLTILLISILSSCADMDSDTVTPPPPTPEPTIAPVMPIVPISGGTLQLSMRPPQTLNPLLNEDATVARVLQLIYEPMITFDEELRPVPHLVDLEFAFNSASVDVTIREDARWSDGSPITADDLVFSLNTLRGAPASVIYKDNIANFSSWQVVSENVVRIVFRTINGGSAYKFNFPIIPNRASTAYPMGSGPFMFDPYNTTETKVFLVHNPYTFRTSPYIESVQVMIIPARETDIHAFDRGLTDIYLAEVAAWARHHSIKPVRFTQQQSMLYDFIGFNFARAIPAQPQFRQVVAHSLNIESIVSNVFLTHAVVTNSPVHPNSWLHETNIPIYEFNMDTAQELASGINMPQQSLEIVVNESNMEGIRIAQTLVSQLNTINIPLELTILPFEDYIWRIQNGYFDLFIGTFNLSMQPDLRFAFHSESVGNIISYNSAELDLLLESAAAAATDTHFQRALSDVQFHIGYHLPVISLAFRHTSVITSPRIQGDLDPAPDNIFINVQNWFIHE